MTKVLGFRADPSSARYAVVTCDGANFDLRNASSESRLVYPADITEAPKKVIWLYREIERIFHADPAIERVVIKTNEYGLVEKAAMRETSYIEAVLMLLCEQRQIPVSIKTYASLSTRGADVKAHAEQRVGRTTKYWDNKIADAVIAGWWGSKPS
jgi:hypothetical protein